LCGGDEYYEVDFWERGGGKGGVGRVRIERVQRVMEHPEYIVLSLSSLYVLY
jgi:hypothetical protein